MGLGLPARQLLLGELLRLVAEQRLVRGRVGVRVLGLGLGLGLGFRVLGLGLGS